MLGADPVHFREAGGEIEHTFRVPLTIGVRGGLLRDTFDPDPSRQTNPGRWTRSTNYLNPFIATERRTFGIGIGWVRSERKFVGSDEEGYTIPLSGHVRFGSSERTAVTVRLMEAVPLYSGGGYFEFGFAFGHTSRADGWVGLSAGGPYDGLGLGLRGAYGVIPTSRLALQLRLGHSGGKYQNGVSLSVEQRFRGGP